MLLTLLLAVHLQLDTSHPGVRFDPRAALGATIDAHEEGESAQVFTNANVKRMRSAGFHPLSYRLATELAGGAWHWNPRGTWSGNNEGYWTSSSEPGPPITISYGYRLPRRGNTRDQAHDTDYSRIDDGDPSTFWKSHPYLHPAPQWVLIDLGTARHVDRIDVDWGDPRPESFEQQYWVGEDPIDEPQLGYWKRLERRTAARFFRLLIVPQQVGRVGRVGPVATSSYLALPGATGRAGGDWRDHAGVAIREIYVRDGARDWVRHEKSNRQTVIWVSSTDPWHRASDIDEGMEQLGLDAVFASGLTNRLPMLAPVSVLYGTPEDAAAEVTYLKKYRVRQIELGEEPDGQNMSPEDYGALYTRWAKAIHAVDPSLQLGGPAFQSTRDVIAFWPDDRGRTSWMRRFLDVVPRNDFNFFSFEWYPFDDVCQPPSKQLPQATSILDRVLGAWKREGVPQDIPWIVSEYGWSSYPANAEVEMPGALFNAQFVADFLLRGGTAAYFYGLEPRELFSMKCGQFGALTLFVGERKVPAFYVAQMVMREWLQPALLPTPSSGPTTPSPS